MIKKTRSKLLSLFAHSTFLLFVAILCGSAMGLAAPDYGQALSQWIDPTIFMLVFFTMTVDMFVFIVVN